MKRLAVLWSRAFLAVVLVSVLGCTGDIGGVSQPTETEEPSLYCHGGWHGHHHHHYNFHDVLVVNLGASISSGYTLDPTLLGVDADPIIAGNDHIPRFEALVGQALATTTASYNLSIPGATSTEIAAEELPDALSEMRRYVKGSVITIESGGNDLRAFQQDYLAQCMSPEPADQYACVVALTTTLDTMDANLRTMLGELREAAPDAPIIVQTQYNPLYGELPGGVPCADDATRAFADAVFEGDPATNGAPVLGMNPRIRAIAAEYGAAVADIAGYLYQSGEFTNPMYYGADCTHPAGTRDAVEYLGLPADTVGAGFEAHYDAFAYAFSSLL